MTTGKLPPKTSSSNQTPNSSNKSKTTLTICLLSLFVIILSFIYALKSSSSQSESQEPSLLLPRIQRNITDLDLNVDKITKLKIQAKRKTIQASSQEEQIIPILFSLEVENPRISYEAPVDLVCVVDSAEIMGRYHSSGPEKLTSFELVQAAIKRLLDFLSDQDRLSIIILRNEHAITLMPLTNVTKENKEIMLSSLKIFKPEGNAIINEGIKAAVEVLNTRDSVNQFAGIFVFSDEWENEDDAKKAIRETFESSGLQDKGVVIHTFGFRVNSNPPILISTAGLGFGKFFYVDPLEQIDEVLKESLSTLQIPIAKNIKISVKPEQSKVFQGDVEIVSAFGDESLWKDIWELYFDSIPLKESIWEQVEEVEGIEELRTEYPSLVTGRQKYFVMELKVPEIVDNMIENEVEVKVASFQMAMTLSSGRQLVKDADLVLKIVKGDDKGVAEDNKEVMKYYYRALGAKVISNLWRAEKAKEIERVKKILRNSVGNIEKFDYFMRDLLKRNHHRVRLDLEEDINQTISPNLCENNF